MWKKILLAVVGAIALFVIGTLIAASTRPDRMKVVREIDVAAPPASVFPHLVDFHRWAAWSPWEKLDPGMQRDYSGTPGAVGSSYHWSGNDQVGEGRMTLSSARPSEQVAVQLEFLKPWQATNQVEFALAPTASGTHVSWTMTGESSLPMKTMQLFMDMDAMIGKDFERGLSGLKQVSERTAAAAPAR